MHRPPAQSNVEDSTQLRRRWFVPALAFAVMICALLVGAPAFAELPPDVDAVAEHMAFLGYQCERKEDRLECQHAQNVNTAVRGLQGGTLLIAFLIAEDAAKAPDKRLEMLELVNTMNANSTTVIFFLDEDGDLGASTWFPSRYDKATFGRILERWNTDIREALQRDPVRSRALLR
ncbi:MAG TPA: YbjN domain-containing protein [Myxococcota bacterium]|nr:YbjN domain-containing protein [Myxococcota bacterium]